MGKSALAATIVQRFKPIYHLCQRDNERTVRADEVISNLRVQAVRHLPPDLSAATFADALDALAKRSIIPTALIDGLDEMDISELNKLLKKLGELKQQCSAIHFILLGQPQVQSEIRRSFVPDVIRLRGLKERDITTIADYLELWNVGWCRKDSIKLARNTDGMPLFVVQVLRDIANGFRNRADLARLPKTVMEYWEQMISRALKRLSHSFGLDLTKVRKISSDALKAINRDVGRSQLVPDYPSLARAMKEEIERSTQIENFLLVPTILAVSPLPLSRIALSEIGGIESEEIAEQLKEFRGFVTETEAEGDSTFRLHHKLAGDFLREEYAEVSQAADKLLIQWASHWREGDARRDVYPLILSRKWRANPGSDQIAKATAALLRSWDFLVPQLCVSGVRSLIAFCEVFTSREKETSDRIRASFEAEAQIKESSKRGGRRVLAEMERRLREEREKFEMRRREEPDGEEKEIAIDETNESNDAKWAAELSAMLANHAEQEEREKQRLAEPLPPNYFADWGNVKATLAEIRTGYAGALEENSVCSDCFPAIRRIRQIESFLRANELGLTLTLGEADPMPGIAAIMERSHLLGGTTLKKRANGIVAANPSPRLYIRPSPEQKGSSERCFVHLNRRFCMAVGASILVYVLDDPGYSQSPSPGRQTRLAIHNWLEEGAPKSVQVDGRAAVVAMSSDGSRVLLQIDRRREERISHSFHVLDLEGSETLEVAGTKEAKFVGATPDLRFGLFASDHRPKDSGDLIFVDLVERTVVARCKLSEGDHYVRKGCVTADGAFAVVLFDGPKSYFLWDPWKNDLHSIHGIHYPVPDRFSLSPNGRFLFSGRSVLDIVEDEIVRKFRDVDGEGPSAFSNDGRILAVGNATGQIVVFDVEQGRLIGSVRCRQPPEELVLSPDGRFALIRTRLDHFTAVDLTASSIPARRGRLSLELDLELIPVAPERQELACWKREGDCFQIVDLRTGALREVLVGSTGGKFLSAERRFLGGYVR